MKTEKSNPKVLTIDELFDFLNNKMSMTANYQPVIIRELLKRSGTASVDELLKSLMIEDQLLIIKWRKILMNWPKKTLSNRKIVAYNKTKKEFELLVQLSDQQRIDELIKICTKKIMSFDTPVIRREAALRFQLLERAHGRCQACGISSFKCPLDIDHIVPRAEAERKRGIWHGKVPNRKRALIDIDDIENLQVLCEKCNRGKRDQGKFHDFRPSKISLIESGSAMVEAVMNATKDDPKGRTEILVEVKRLLEAALS